MSKILAVLLQILFIANLYVILIPISIRSYRIEHRTHVWLRPRHGIGDNSGNKTDK
jgi:hypothetical protein